MEKKQVIIHTGFHKTASSSIQHTLGRNRQWLLDNGCCYPEIKVDGTIFYNQSIPLYGLFTEKPQNFKHYWYHNQLDHDVANEAIDSALEELLVKQRKILFSDEFVSTLKQQELKRMKNFFEQKGFDVRVISYIREPFNNLVSVAQQRAKAQNHIKSVLDSNYLDKFVKRIENIRAVFGKDAEFYSFEKACEHELGPVGFFLSLLGLTIESDRVLKVNESSSQQAIRLSSFITEKSPLYSSSSTVNPIRKKDDLLPIFSLPGDKFQLTKEEVDMAGPTVEYARGRISELLGEAFLPDLKIKFVENVDWNSNDLNNVIKLLPALDLHINIRIYDYFSNEYQEGKIGYDLVSDIGAAVRKRLDDEFNQKHRVVKKAVASSPRYIQKIKNIISNIPLVRKLTSRV